MHTCLRELLLTIVHPDIADPIFHLPSLLRATSPIAIIGIREPEESGGCQEWWVQG